MNEVLQAIRDRRSIRHFKPDMPSRELIDQILEAGLYAPSGMNRQGVITIAVANPDAQKCIRDANRKIGGWDESHDPFYGAPVYLIVLAEKGWRNAAYDGSLVMANLMLATHALGLGGIWINRAKEEFEQPEFIQLLRDLGIEGEWEGVGHCAIGYIDGEIPQAAPRKAGRIYYL